MSKSREQSSDEAAQQQQRTGEAGRRVIYRTGADQPWEPEDLAVAEGRDPTPRNVERARRELRRLGSAAIERTVP